MKTKFGTIVEVVWFIAIVVFALLIGRRLIAQEGPPMPPKPPTLEAGVTPQTTVFAAPAVGRSVLAEVDLPNTNIVGCLILWGHERGGYTNSIQAMMPETTVPPVAQIATARINNLESGDYFFTAQTFDGTNYSAFYPTNGMRWPTRYIDELHIEHSLLLSLGQWTNLLTITGTFTNAGDNYRLRATRRIEE